MELFEVWTMSASKLIEPGSLRLYVYSVTVVALAHVPVSVNSPFKLSCGQAIGQHSGSYEWRVYFAVRRYFNVHNNFALNSSLAL
jgi:hypothetical protein